MVDAHFKKIPLEDVNRWNLEKKFIRAVSYNVGRQGIHGPRIEPRLRSRHRGRHPADFLVGFQDDVKTVREVRRSKQ